MQKKHAFEVIPRALVKTVRFPEGQAYENVQDAVFGTAFWRIISSLKKFRSYLGFMLHNMRELADAFTKTVL